MTKINSSFKSTIKGTQEEISRSFISLPSYPMLSKEALPSSHTQNPKSSRSTSPLPELVTNSYPSAVSKMTQFETFKNNAFQSSTETGQHTVNRRGSTYSRILSHQKPTAAQESKYGSNSKILLLLKTHAVRSVCTMSTAAQN